MQWMRKPAFAMAGMIVAGSWTLPLSHVAAANGEVTAVKEEVKIIPVAVQLTPTGTLQGTVMSPGGRPAAQKKVLLGKDGKLVAQASTDAAGQFAIANLQPGTYQIVSNDTAAWLVCHGATENVPQAAPRIILSEEAMVARGQARSLLLHPLFIALTIAAAIAIPIAITNDDDDAS